MAILIRDQKAKNPVGPRNSAYPKTVLPTKSTNVFLQLIAIQSNDVDAYPDDGPEQMKAEIELRGYTFPYLWDADQEVAKAYTAACTPDFFLFDHVHQLAYRGQLDRTRPTRIRSGVYDSEGNEPTGEDLRTAIEAVLKNFPVPEKQYPSAGCNIKWKPGNEPDYAR